VPSVLITGSNRGLGLEWARHYAEKGWSVYASCRHPSEAHDLQRLSATHNHLSIHRMDVTRPDEINAAAVELRKKSIDVLVSNAGVYLEKHKRIGLQRLDYQDWEYTFQVNTLGPVRLAEAFSEHLVRSSRRLLAVVSTHMASIADITDPGDYYYRSTKAALNAAMEGIAQELRAEGIGLLLLHPGWVRTRMGGEGTDLLPPESVGGMAELIERFSLAQTGKFFRYDGVEMPW
jgi:NAD(P)-dependent dehydrogenase (short-subunit alcohol dehydrogenase family)